MLIFANFRRNNVIKFTITGSYILNTISCLYFSRDFLGLHGLIGQIMPKMPKKTKKKSQKKTEQIMLIFAYLRRMVGDMKK